MSSPRGIMRQLTTGLKDAAGIIVGEAGARTLPVLLKLPQQGALGLGVQAASGIVLGYVADRFLGRDFGRMVLAGALAAPLKTMIVAHKVPFFSTALSPATSAQGMGAYKGLRAYVAPRALPARTGMGAYVRPPGGLGSYVRRPSAMQGYNFATQ